MAINKIKTNSISDSAVTSASIQDSAVTNAKISACAAIAQSKVTGLATSLSTLCSSATSLTGLINTNQFNIGLLGFKMAITEGLTVFNLVDGIVDEFEDESGVDNSASTSLTYNSTDDYYINSTQPDGLNVPAISAGFGVTSITEPDTSTAGTNPAYGSGSFGTFTVPTSTTTLGVYVWGSGGSSIRGADYNYNKGGGGGFSTGNLAVTSSQTLHIGAGEGGIVSSPRAATKGFLNGGYGAAAGPSAIGGNGGGLSGIFASASPNFTSSSPSVAPIPGTLPNIYMIAGSGGGGGSPSAPGPTAIGGGAGGGTTGEGGGTVTNQTSTSGVSGTNAGGGSQTVGGQGSNQSGGYLFGGDGSFGGGGAGYYGGGGASAVPQNLGSGGGGSSYIGNPNISSGSTEDGTNCQNGGRDDPSYTVGIGEGGCASFSPAPVNNPGTAGEDGFVLLTAAGVCASTTSSTIISDPFTSTTVPTTTRIVVFEENVGTPSLNTDIIASVSRNGGTNFTNVTLTDSGYVTGSSGQRILTGTATISGQPSGQSMKWKLQLANNTVKIHGVALQWS